MSEDDAYSRFAANLARTERMSRIGLTAYRDGLLARLLSFARTQSLFYRDRLEPLFRTTDAPDLRAWREVPILRRSDLERHIDRINPTEPPADIGEVTTRRTSGTTGARGMTFRICALVRIADACMMQRLYRWWGYDDSAPMASIRHYMMNDRGFPNGKVETNGRIRAVRHCTIRSTCARQPPTSSNGWCGVAPVIFSLSRRFSRSSPAIRTPDGLRCSD